MENQDCRTSTSWIAIYATMVPKAKIIAFLLCVLAVGLLYRITIKENTFNLKALFFPSRYYPDDLLSAGNGIMFVETTDRMEPPHLVLCSIESAARAYPDRPVVYFMKGLAEINSDIVRMSYPTLLSYDNIYFFPLRMNVLLNNTPLMPWYEKVNPKTERYWNHVSSDACRLALIYKYGGIYMDTDIITFRPIPEKNFLAAETSQMTGSAVLAFAPKHTIVWQFMEDFVNGYDGTVWGQQGPLLYNRILNRLYCKVPPFKGQEDIMCGTILFLNMERFFPVPGMQWETFFQVCEKLPTFNNSYALHLFNYANSNQRKVMVPGSNTMVEHLYKKYCPITYHAVLKGKPTYLKYMPIDKEK
uniref:Alpha-1,4-N-acetylglucosaminyltransferase n=2 Tax=Xenopus tropicalis TaxID=8364 RepID=F7D6U9_XENTR